MRALAVLLACAAALAGCPPAEHRASADASPAGCARVGQSCEVSPGKLGSCVARDDCRDPGGCFVCQSQH